MNWRDLINLRGISFWWLASAIGLNIGWTICVLLFALRILGPGAETVENAQLALMGGSFLGPLLIGWLIGRWADDGQGPAYGLLGSLGSLVLIVFAVLPSGPLGLLIAVVAVAGGLNGGLLSERRRHG